VPQSPPTTETTAREFDSYSRCYEAAVNKAISFSGLKVDFFTRVKGDYLLDIVSRELGPQENLSILDVGCGVGNYHARLARAFAKVHGVDVSAESLKVAAERNSAVEYHHYDGTHLPFQDASLDVAFAICVYHHIPIANRPRISREVRRVLRPGGLFVIFEHNPFNPVTMRIVNNCPFDADAVLLKPADTEGLMRDAGFAEMATRYILTIPAAGAILRGFDQWFGHLPLGAQFFTKARVC
jgi:ubiquinone/menaquinone biosynthesis C-methylase UbiE